MVGVKSMSVINHLRTTYARGENLPGKKQFVAQVIRLERLLGPTAFNEELEIVSADGQTLGYQAPRWFVHLTGLRHLISRVVLFGDEMVLLQRRGGDRFGVSGTYDLTAGGHVLAGENPLEAAYREMTEEIGIDRSALIGETLHQIGKPHPVYSAKPLDLTINNEVTILYGGRLANGKNIMFNIDQTEAGRLFFQSLEKTQAYIDQQLAASRLICSLPIFLSHRDRFLANYR